MPAMRKKHRNPLMALALLLAVGGGAYLWDQQLQEKKDAEEKEEKIWEVEESAIQFFRLIPREGGAISCRRDGNGENWRIVSPLKLRADSMAVSGLLNAFTDLPGDEVVAEKPASFEDYGLDPPEQVVEVSLGDGKEDLVLRVGRETPTGDGHYVQASGSPKIYKIPAYLKSSLAKSLFDLRDRRVLPIDRAKITKLQVSGGSTNLNFEKAAGGDWQLVLPPAVRTDKFSVRSLVSSLESAQMQSVVEEEPRNSSRYGLSRYGLSRPSLRIRVTQGGDEEELLIGKKSEEARYYAQRNGAGPVFTVFDTFVNQFTKPADDFRNSALFDFPSFDTKRVEIRAADLDFHLGMEKKENEWRKVSGEGAPPEKSKIEGFLSDLRALKAQNYTTDRPGRSMRNSLSRYRLENPELTIRITWGDDRQESVSLSQVDEQAYAKRAGGASVYEIDSAALERIRTGIAELQNSSALSTDSSESE